MPTTLITGANRGIGLELTRGFAADGWQVHAVCRQPDKAKNLKALDGRVTVHRADVTDGLRIASLARDLSDEPIDILISNAGLLGTRSAFGETDYDEWIEVLKVNTLNRSGKRRRVRGTNRVGQKPATKRAIVTLAAGEIPLFEN